MLHDLMIHFEPAQLAGEWKMGILSSIFGSLDWSLELFFLE